MCITMTLLHGLYIIFLLQPAFTCESDCINIGIISKGTEHVSTEKLSYYGKNISLVRYWINTSEIYHIFRTIKTLDGNDDVDVIILFDYDVSVLRMPQLLKTGNKKLIKWGERQNNNEQENKGEQDNYYIEPGDICGKEELPNLTPEDPNCIKHLNATFEQRDESVLTFLGPQAITGLVKLLQWRSLFLFYETSTEVEISDLVDSLSKEGVLLSLFNIDQEESLHNRLLQIYQLEVNIHHRQEINIVVVCKFSCARYILRTANEFDTTNLEHKTLLKMFSRWLIVVYGHSQGVSRALESCAFSIDNVAIISFPGISGNGTGVFNKVLQSVLLEILKEELSGSHLKFKKAVIDHLGTKAAIWSPNCQCLAYNIDTLLHAKSGRALSSVGYVKNNGNVVVTSDIFPNTKYGYNKRHFNVSTVQGLCVLFQHNYLKILKIASFFMQSFPFVMKKEKNGTIEYEGFCMDILKELAMKLNFTYTVTEPSDGKWGDYEDMNLTYNGLVGQLQRQEVDIVAAPLSTSHERKKVMDFSYPFQYEYTSVVFKKPDVTAKQWRTLIYPFKWEVLVCIGLALPIMTILAFLIEKYNPYYDTPDHSTERDRNGGLHKWHNSLWYMYGALLCQGGVHLPNSTAGRTLVSSWWLFCIIIVGIYSGNLIAFLTVTKEKPPFETLAEMIKLKGSYRWGIVSDTIFSTVLLKSDNPTYRALGDGIRDFNKTDPDVLSTDREVQIGKVKKGHYAWICSKTIIEIVMAKECSLTSIKTEFLPLKDGFGFVKGSPHTPIFTEQIIKLFEGGLFPIWKRKWWPKANFCSGSTITEAKPISLIDVQSAFYVCLIGVLLGSIAFITELIVHRYRTRGKNKAKGSQSSED